MKRMWVILLLLTGVAHGQTSRGTVTGTIRDASGAIISGASVLLTHTETGVRRVANSNEAGIYRFDAVDLGVYQIEVTQPGFRPSLITMVRVDANRATTIDARLDVGITETAIEVSAVAAEQLVKDSPLRGGNFLAREIRNLPLKGLNPLSLARTLPGVVEPSGSFGLGGIGGSGGQTTAFSVNGQRQRGNNFLLDGTENNDIAFNGVAQPFNIADAVEEVSVQTGNFSVEFGRAAGGVFNVVTKSGANDVHGTLLYRYQSQRFNSVSNVDKLNGIPKSVFSHNIYGFTLGGPVRKSKTFLFGGFQQDSRHSTRNFPLTLPTEAAVARLRALFPSNQQLDLYLKFLGDMRGVAAPFGIQLGVDPTTGLDRGSVQFASAPLAMPARNDAPEWLIRFDHHRSEAHRLSGRYIYDSRVNSPSDTGGLTFPGFIADEAAQNQNLLFADTYSFGPSLTNEFRFSYGRLHADDPNRISPLSVPEARTLPRFSIENISAPGKDLGQFRYANNLLFQETQTRLSGRHTFRYGAEFLRQFATQAPAARDLRLYEYKSDSNAPGYSAFANFLDDFSGPSGRIRRVFGANIFHPNTFRQSYFFQDSFKATATLMLTLGLRYENFGMPLNVLPYPAFPGFDPGKFLERTKVNRDDNNFGPAFGLAWSPSYRSGWLAKLFGDRKTVWRGGYQISYDAWPTQIVSLQAGSAPNASETVDTAPPGGRGYNNFIARMPATPTPLSPTGGQTFSNEKDLRSPYTERWSFGFQRELPGKLLLDTSYVASVGHKLTTRADFNPQQLNNVRLYPGLGQRWVRTSQGNSAYHSLQSRIDRRLGQGFQVSASYTWSRFLDSTSEGVAAVSNQVHFMQLTSIPVMEGGMKLDRGLSEFHRGQRLTVVYTWLLPGPRSGWWRHALGDWSISGITSFQSGTPFTVLNGPDRNNDGAQTDRPDIGNPLAPLSSRAASFPGCPTLYRNLDNNACVTPSDVHWIQAPVGSLPNGATVGRNTLLTGGTNNFDLSLSKSFSIAEQKRLEFRWEAFNAFNHPQFTAAPALADRNVTAAPASRFLNRDFTDSGVRTMWTQVKVVF